MSHLSTLEKNKKKSPEHTDGFIRDFGRHDGDDGSTVGYGSLVASSLLGLEQKTTPQHYGLSRFLCRQNTTVQSTGISESRCFERTRVTRSTRLIKVEGLEVASCW